MLTGTVFACRVPQSLFHPCTAYLQYLQKQKGNLRHEKEKFDAMIKENSEKIKMNKQLPYLVGNVVEVLCSLSPSAPRPTFTRRV